MHKRVRGVNSCPWLNSDIKRDIREYDYFVMKAREIRLFENWAKYRYFRNRVAGKIKKAKEAYNRRVIILYFKRRLKGNDFVSPCAKMRYRKDY